ncbi:MAG: AgmX/PglI C-terminal domain-containing protein [Deltaproteobacteria bacterium]|nr:AgmX/PglI C-terminal domain-containing protein [Deltaproteobacteria bacterium]MBN2672813.1 AgmX/PglI C-terminal domain-containing protein [Deltaproteobacteria bacterium]
MKSAKYTLMVLGTLVAAFGLMSCGSLNPKTEGQIYSALEAQSDAFQQCYEEALKKDRNAKGDVSVTLKFEPKSKRPKDTKVAKSDIDDPKMMQCVEKAADKVRIEDAPGVFVEGQYTVNFEFSE